MGMQPHVDWFNLAVKEPDLSVSVVSCQRLRRQNHYLSKDIIYSALNYACQRINWAPKLLFKFRLCRPRTEFEVATYLYSAPLVNA